MNLSKEELLHLYYSMMLARLFEERAADWYTKGLVRESSHQCIGQEAIGVGTCHGLRKEDQIVPSLRTRAAFFAKGVDARTTVLAMAGKKTSPSKGHETSHHAVYPEHGVLYSTGMVGSSISIGVGAALAFKLQDQDNVVMNYFGDGASNRGDFHEAINMAAVWQLPVIFVCENNDVALTTPAEKANSVRDIAIRAQGYGIPGVIVDGSDLMAVIEAAGEAVQRARRGEGPTLIECKVARLCPHVSFLPETRSEKELERLREAYDPIQRYERYLLDHGFTQDELQAVADSINRELDEAISGVEEMPLPSRAEIEEDVYAGTEGL